MVQRRVALHHVVYPVHNGVGREISDLASAIDCLFYGHGIGKYRVSRHVLPDRAGKRGKETKAEREKHHQFDHLRRGGGTGRILPDRGIHRGRRGQFVVGRPREKETE